MHKLTTCHVMLMLMLQASKLLRSIMLKKQLNIVNTHKRSGGLNRRLLLPKLLASDNTYNRLFKS